MKRQINYNKILLVIFITLLIWAWADKKQDEEYPFSNAVIRMDKAASSDLYVSFDNKASVTIKKLDLKGPATKIEEIKRDIREGSDLEFYFVPQKEAMANPGKYTLDLLAFIKRSTLLADLGVSAESCEPNSVEVEVIRLVEKSLTVKCKREDGSEIKAKSIEPDKVEMKVPEDWSGERLTAYATLTDNEISQARTSAIRAFPKINFPPGETTKSRREVKITMSAETETLKEYPITGATVGFVLSPNLINLIGEYKVEMLNYSDMATVKIKATPAAMEAYKQQSFQILVYILDKDVKIDGIQSKEATYNFPAEYVADDKIKLNQLPATARFKLVPSEAKKPVSGTE